MNSEQLAMQLEKDAKCLAQAAHSYEITHEKLTATLWNELRVKLDRGENVLALRDRYESHLGDAMHRWAEDIVAYEQFRAGDAKPLPTVDLTEAGQAIYDSIPDCDEYRNDTELCQLVEFISEFMVFVGWNETPADALRGQYMLEWGNREPPWSAETVRRAQELGYIVLPK